MSASVTLQQGALAARIIEDTAVTSTAVTNVTGAAANLYYVEIDNTANTVASFVKFYNNASPTVGTPPPDVALRPVAGAKEYFVFPTSIAFATALSYACVTTAGTAGTTSPTNSVIVRMATS